MNAPGLLALPWHLRHAVWSLIVPRAVHVFDREGRLALSACYPSQVREPDGSECTRRVGSDEGFNFQDRQESQWALHWTCEEQRDKGLGRDVEALMMSCKPM